MNLSRTGEVGEFLDDNQFAPPGGSFNKCGPESIALCFHSVAPGQHNPFTPQDIHRMAHDDYVAFVDMAGETRFRWISYGILSRPRGSVPDPTDSSFATRPISGRGHANISMKASATRLQRS